MIVSPITTGHVDKLDLSPKFSEKLGYGVFRHGLPAKPVRTQFAQRHLKLRQYNGLGGGFPKFKDSFNCGIYPEPLKTVLRELDLKTNEWRTGAAKVKSTDTPVLTEDIIADSARDTSNLVGGTSSKSLELAGYHNFSSETITKYITKGNSMGDQSTTSGLVQGGLTRMSVLKDIASRQKPAPVKSAYDDIFQKE